MVNEVPVPLIVTVPPNPLASVKAMSNNKNVEGASNVKVSTPVRVA